MKNHNPWSRVDQTAASEREFGEIVAQDYYPADSHALDLAIPRTRTFHLAKTQAGLVPVAHFSGHSLGVRRTWKHIRQGPSNLYVIWFPLDGHLLVTQDDVRTETVTDRQLVITCGDRPFQIKALAGQELNRCSQLHVLVPKHLMHTHLPEVDRICGRAFPAEEGEALIARTLFSALIRETETMDPRASSKLSAAALETLATYIRACSGKVFNQSVQEAQLERLLMFIREHLSTQGLTADHVARSCNISLRYLHYLMKLQTMTFSQFLWSCRLEQARLWLRDGSYDHFHIVDIAYMAGFSTVSHFSRSYRNRFGIIPTEERVRASLID